MSRDSAAGATRSGILVLASRSTKIAPISTPLMRSVLPLRANQTDLITHSTRVALPDFEIQSDLTSAHLIRLRDSLVACGMKVDQWKWANVLDNFALMLARLSESQRELVLTLLSDFLYCNVPELFPLLASALGHIPAEMLRGVDKVILLPLAETRANGKPKSSSALLYPAVHLLIPCVGAFIGVEATSYEKMSLVNEYEAQRTGSLIIFLDDFIGSGQTAVKTIVRFRAECFKPTDRIVIVSAIAQQQGIDKIATQGIDTYAGITRTKGISESAIIPDPIAALEIMDGLETRLGVANAYKRGFGQCEALVGLIRTPNNTFPLFWWESTASDESWPAPFTR